jgi:preprotein translocase subunit SecE
MGETNGSKVGFFKGVRNEFKKIVWPNSRTIVRNTYVVVLTTAIIGAVIALIDTGFQFVIFDLILGNL